MGPAPSNGWLARLLRRFGVELRGYRVRRDEDAGLFWYVLTAYRQVRESAPATELKADVQLSTNRRGFCHAYVTVRDTEEDVKLALAIPRVFALWLGLDFGRFGLGAYSRNPLAKLFVKHDGYDERGVVRNLRHGFFGYADERETGVSFADGKLRFHLLSAVHGSTSEGRLRKDRRRKRFRPLGVYDETPFIRGGFEWSLKLDPRDLLLGKREVLRREELERERGVTVTLPENDYGATVTIERHLVGRSRWPWTRTIRHSSHVEIPAGVPVPGKGENSWDCEDDAIYSQSAGAHTVAEAVSGVVRSALTTRERYANLDWRPRAGAEA